MLRKLRNIASAMGTAIKEYFSPTVCTYCGQAPRLPGMESCDSPKCQERAQWNQAMNEPPPPRPPKED